MTNSNIKLHSACTGIGLGDQRSSPGWINPKSVSLGRLQRAVCST